MRMKTTMKKMTAILAALLMMVQVMPALANDTTQTISGVIAGSPSGYREALEIIASKGTYVLVGQELPLDANQGYTLTWSSADETIATVDGNGVVTALKAGTVTITANEGKDHEASVIVTVVDPEPMITETEASNKQEGKPAEKKVAVIVINAESSRYVYDGEEHTLDTYVATSNQDFFDPSKVQLVGTIGVSGTACGTYRLELKESDFKYNDPDVIASFVVNDGWLKIRPAKVTVTPKAMEKKAGEADPELTAVVEGLYGDDTVSYTLSRDEGEAAGQYIIEAKGDAEQGNYRLEFGNAIFTIKGIPEQTLYNLAEINGKWCRLAKTTIRTEKEISKNLGKVIQPADYSADAYDFANTTITVNGREYIYDCPKNADAIEAGAMYYTATLSNVECVKDKIGGMDGNNPRWLVSAEQRYDDPNKTSGFHRNFKITLYDNPVEQELYNMLSINGEANYYRLQKTMIVARPADEFKDDVALKKEEYTIPGGEYDFTDVTLTIGGETYRYSDHELTGEYESYYTVSLFRVVKTYKTNKNDEWFNNPDGWLDGANYAAEGNNVDAFHRDYKATLHKGTKKNRSVTISSNWPEGKIAYAGAEITLTAELHGFSENVTLQWEYSTDTENWTAQPGANGITYTYILDETTCRYYWRVVADDVN